MFSRDLIDTGFDDRRGFGFYFSRYVFDGIDLSSKNIADVGGGNGIASFYACVSDPSCNSWVVDPIEEGSNSQMMQQYSAFQNRFSCERVRYHRDVIDTLEHPQMFDILLLHNSINHIVEDLLGLEQTDLTSFRQRLQSIISRLRVGGVLIVAECGRRNLWGDLGFKSPFSPTIEWKIHKEPEFWREILEPLGVEHLKTTWSARREFGSFGKRFLSNRFAAYVTNSHFVSVYKRA